LPNHLIQLWTEQWQNALDTIHADIITLPSSIQSSQLNVLTVNY